MSASEIVYASFDRFPAPKGAAVHIRAFVDALAESFGPVDLLALENPEHEGPVALHPNARFFPARVTGPDLMAQALAFRTRLRMYWSARRRARVVHVRSIFEGYPIAVRKDALTDRLVFEANGLPSIELKYHYPRVAEDAELMQKLVAQEDLLIARADLLVTPSPVTAAHLASRGASTERIRVIPNGVDPTLFAHRRPRARTGPLRLLYSGTPSAWQGVDKAIEACRLLRRDLPTQLVIAAPLRRDQRRRLLESCGELLHDGGVELLPPMSQAELAALHHGCDAVLVPLTACDRNLDQGCCPLKLLEALSAGTPVVASDLPVVRAVVEPDVHALLVRPGSAKAIKDGLLKLAGDPMLAEALSARGRALIEARYTWSHARASLVEAYEALLDGDVGALEQACATE